MNYGPHTHSHGDLNSSMDTCGISLRLKDYIIRCVDLHSYPAPGVLIGAFMVDYALELIRATPSDKLYAVCETPKCVPDAIQAIAHCTTGNHRLRIVPVGKFAITLNAASPGPVTEGVRVYIDREKLKKYPTIGIWYVNSPAFVKDTMTLQLREEIFRSGRAILSSEAVRLTVSPKKRWKSITCPCCGDTVPDYLFEKDRCAACGSLKYYDKIS